MNTPAPVERKRTSAWEMYRAIVGIGAFCALLIVSVFNATAARIADNKARFLASAVAQVLPASDSTVEVTVDGSGALVAAADSADLPVFLGYGEDGELVGAVITAQGMCYADNIRVLYAYSFEKQAITGFKVLESKETPGLGDKVEIEPHFLANFDALDARLDEDGSALANAIVCRPGVLSDARKASFMDTFPSGPGRSSIVALLGTSITSRHMVTVII